VPQHQVRNSDSRPRKYLDPKVGKLHIALEVRTQGLDSALAQISRQPHGGYEETDDDKYDQDTRNEEEHADEGYRSFFVHV
jgi:hypothetical protein